MRLTLLGLTLWSRRAWSTVVVRLVLMNLFVGLIRYDRSVSVPLYRREPGIWCRSLNHGRYTVYFGVHEHP